MGRVKAWVGEQIDLFGPVGAVFMWGVALLMFLVGLVMAGLLLFIIFACFTVDCADARGGGGGSIGPGSPIGVAIYGGGGAAALPRGGGCRCK